MDGQKYTVVVRRSDGDDVQVQGGLTLEEAVEVRSRLVKMLKADGWDLLPLGGPPRMVKGLGAGKVWQLVAVEVE